MYNERQGASPRLNPIPSNGMTVQTPASITLRGVHTHNLKVGRSRSATQAVDRRDRAERRGQELACVRHPLRGGSPALCRDIFTLRPSVLRPARQARRRCDLRNSSGNCRGPAPWATLAPHDRRHDHRRFITSLGLLFTRAGQVVCRQCGGSVAPASAESVSRVIEEWAAGTRYEIGFPLDFGPSTDHDGVAGIAARPRLHAACGLTTKRSHSTGRLTLCPRGTRSTSSSTAWSVAATRPSAAPTRSRRPSTKALVDAACSPSESHALFVRGWRCSHLRHRSYRAAAGSLPLQLRDRSLPGLRGDGPDHGGRYGADRSRPFPIDPRGRDRCLVDPRISKAPG